MAKELGIKPGSADFHALKRGDFALTGRPHGKPPEVMEKAGRDTPIKAHPTGKAKRKNKGAVSGWTQTRENDRNLLLELLAGLSI